MSGVPQFNIPTFDRVAGKLRDFGYNIVSPAELDTPSMRERALASPDGDLAKLEQETNETWGEVLGKDVTIVADKVQGIIFLPNWTTSRGAKLEAFVGLLTGKSFAFVDEINGGVAIEHVEKHYVQQSLIACMP